MPPKPEDYKQCSCGKKFRPPTDHPNQRLCKKCLRKNHVKSVQKSRDSYKVKFEKPQPHVFTYFDGDTGEIQEVIRHVINIPPGAY